MIGRLRCALGRHRWVPLIGGQGIVLHLCRRPGCPARVLQRIGAAR